MVGLSVISGVTDYNYTVYTTHTLATILIYDLHHLHLSCLL